MNVGTRDMNMGGRNRATGHVTSIASIEKEQRKKTRKRGGKRGYFGNLTRCVDQYFEEVITRMLYSDTKPSRIGSTSPVSMARSHGPAFLLMTTSIARTNELYGISCDFKGPSSPFRSTSQC